MKAYIPIYICNMHIMDLYVYIYNIIIKGLYVYLRYMSENAIEHIAYLNNNLQIFKASFCSM